MRSLGTGRSRVEIAISGQMSIVQVFTWWRRLLRGRLHAGRRPWLAFFTFRPGLAMKLSSFKSLILYDAIAGGPKTKRRTGLARMTLKVVAMPKRATPCEPDAETSV